MFGIYWFTSLLQSAWQSSKGMERVVRGVQFAGSCYRLEKEEEDLATFIFHKLVKRQRQKRNCCRRFWIQPRYITTQIYSITINYKETDAESYCANRRTHICWRYIKTWHCFSAMLLVRCQHVFSFHILKEHATGALCNDTPYAYLSLPKIFEICRLLPLTARRMSPKSPAVLNLYDGPHVYCFLFDRSHTSNTCFQISCNYPRPRRHLRIIQNRR